MGARIQGILLFGASLFSLEFINLHKTGPFISLFPIKVEVYYLDFSEVRALTPVARFLKLMVQGRNFPTVREF